MGRQFAVSLLVAFPPTLLRCGQSSANIALPFSYRIPNTERRKPCQWSRRPVFDGKAPQSEASPSIAVVTLAPKASSADGPVYSRLARQGRGPDLQVSQGRSQNSDQLKPAEVLFARGNNYGADVRPVNEGLGFVLEPDVGARVLHNLLHSHAHLGPFLGIGRSCNLLV